MKIITFLANHWATITMPFLGIAYLLIVADIFNLVPSFVNRHVGFYIVLGLIGVWGPAPRIFNKYKTKRYENIYSKRVFSGHNYKS